MAVTAAMVVALTLVRRRWWGSALVLAVATAAACDLATGNVGRVTALVVVVATASAWLAIWGWPSRRAPHRAAVASPVGLLAVALAGGILLCSTVPRVGLAAAVGALGATTCSLVGLRPARALDEWLLGAARSSMWTAVAGVGAFLAAARVWVPRVAARLGIVAREIGRGADRAWRGLRRMARAGLAVARRPFDAEASRRASSPTRRSRQWAVGGSFLAGTLMALPLYWRQVMSIPTNIFGYTDYPIYLTIVHRISLIPFRQPPHPGFFVETWLAAEVFGLQWGAIAVSALNVGAAAAATTILGYRRGAGRAGLTPGRSVGLSAWYLLAETPAVLPVALGVLALSPRLSVLHTWASPTDTAAFGIAIFAVVLILDLVESGMDPAVPRPSLWAVVAVVVAAGLAKPSFTLPLLPGLVLLALVERRTDVATRWRLVLGVAVPVLLTSIGQVIIVTKTLAPEDRTSRFAIAPLRTLHTIRFGEGGIWFWLGIAIIPICAWIGGRRFWTDVGVRLALAADGAAIVVMLTLAEYGPRSKDGNLSRPAFMWFVLLSLLAARVAALEIAGHWDRRGDPEHRWPSWRWVVLPIAACYLAAGVVVYLDAVGLVRSLHFLPLT